METQIRVPLYCSSTYAAVNNVINNYCRCFHGRKNCSLCIVAELKLFHTAFNSIAFMTDFNKSLQYQISRKSFQSVPEFIHTDCKTDRRKDRSQLIGVFRDYLKALKQLGSSVKYTRKKHSWLNPAPA
jgi:predicted HicB family RNase H-like nuclease